MYMPVVNACTIRILTAKFAVYPGFAWTPDNSHIVIWGQGKLWKAALDGSGSEHIPFEVNVMQRVAVAFRYEQDPAPEFRWRRNRASNAFLWFGHTQGFAE